MTKSGRIAVLMRQGAVVACIAAAAAACKTIDPLFCSEEKPCEDPERPYCDLTGEFPASEGVGRTCIPSPFDAGGDVDAGVDVDGGEGVDGGSAADAGDVDAAWACQPNTNTCSDGILVTCGSTGQIEDERSCNLGCHAQEPRCNDLQPSNNLAAHLDLAASASDVVLSNGTVIDTTNGTVSGVSVSGAFDDAGRPVGIFVIRARSFQAGDVTVVGTRALAVVSDGDVLIEGVLSVSADVKVSGPGALPGANCNGGQGGISGARASGGGGGGFGTTGGNGGSGGVPGGEGGQVAGSATLVPLRGGCEGGVGGVGTNVDDNPISPGPGGGGGGVQIVSRTLIQIESNGFIAANGGPGKGRTGTAGCVQGEPCYPGNGGGSGGGILLEAPDVVIAPGGGLVANGGGGHCFLNRIAEPGQLSATPALGVDCSDHSRFGNGGNGAAGGINATSGVGGIGTDAQGGGGGGGAGRIRVNVPLGTSFGGAGSVISPTATTGSLGVR
jgi:hypothetical protein